VGDGDHSSVDVKDRYEPMPSFAALPLWLWRRTGRRSRVAVVVLAAAGAFGLAALVLDGTGVREDVRRQTASHRLRAEERLRADQAPRRGRAATLASLPEALEQAIDRDAMRRLPRLRSPVTSCRRVAPVDWTGKAIELPASDAYFTCFAVGRTTETGAARLQTGYGFRARANLDTLHFSWCKLNPRPIHADQEEFIRVELSEECVPPQR
jgi:hypothetical protein